MSEIVEQKRSYFESGATLPYDFRVRQLKALRDAIKTREQEALEALRADFQKPALEAYATEIVFLYQEIDNTLRNLKQWMKPRQVNTPLILQPATSEITPQPLGVILIIAPWNYPFHLALAPLIGAIAAGNCAVVKPSEETAHTERLLADLLQNTFDKAYISCVTGPGKETLSPLIEDNRFDHIFYTGGPDAAKSIMALAAPHLTPVTLELGGKSPAIVDKTANVEIAAKRIAWGKFLNAGQTCVAPDYVAVHADVKEKLTASLKGSIKRFFGEDPKSSPDLARIVSARHFKRLSSFLVGNIIYGGEQNEGERYIAPTLIDEPDAEHPAMKEEIFGPILPIISWKEQTEVIQLVRRSPQPLACYLFSDDKKTINSLNEALTFGGGCINHCVLQLANPDLPFGGVGHSGMGSYHGYESFRGMSHFKSLLSTPTWLDHALQYPPYSERKQRLLRWFVHQAPITGI